MGEQRDVGLKEGDERTCALIKSTSKPIADRCSAYLSDDLWPGQDLVQLVQENIGEVCGYAAWDRLVLR